MELLYLFLKDRNVTTNLLKTYYHMNDEEMVQLLLSFIEQSYDTIDDKKILIYAMRKVVEIYGNLLLEDKRRLPYYQRYRTLLGRLKKEKEYQLFEWNDIDRKKEITNLEEMLIQIILYSNMNQVKMLIQKHPLFLLGEVLGKPMIHHIMDQFSSFFNDKDSTKYFYYYRLLKETLNVTGQYPEIQLEIYNYCKAHQDKFLEQPLDEKHKYRRFQLLNRLNDIKSGTTISKDKTKYYFHLTQKDFSNEYIFTIDNHDTELRDDAFSFHVDDDYIYVNFYITDATSTINQESELEKIVMDHWYHQVDDSSMFQQFIKEQLSLHEKENHKVLVYQLKFDNYYHLEEIHFGVSDVMINKNYTYQEINQFLNGQVKNPLPWNELYALTADLRDRNPKRMQYHILKEIYQAVIMNKTTEKIQPKNEKGSTLIISRFKELINFIETDICVKNEIPIMYRVNRSRTVSQEEMDHILKCCNNMMLTQELCDQLSKINLGSTYRSENIGHNGLGLPHYSTFTIPIRNQVSLTNQRIWKKIVLEKKFESIPTCQSMLKKFDEKQIEKENKQVSVADCFHHLLINIKKCDKKIAEIEKALSLRKMTIHELMKRVGIEKEELLKLLKYLESCFHVEEKDGYYNLLIDENTKVGVFRAKTRSYGFIETEDKKQYLVPSRYFHGCKNGEMVLVRLYQEHDHKIAKIIRKETPEKLFGTVFKKDKNFYVVLDSVDFPNPILIGRSSQLKPNDQVIVSLEVGKGKKHLQIEEILGNQYDPNVSIQTIWKKKQVYPSFRKYVMDEVACLSSNIDEEKSYRKDCTDKKVFSVGGTFQEYAFSIEKQNDKYLLDIYFPDFSYYIKEDGAMDNEAQRRQVSIHALGENAPLYPEELLNQFCLFQEGKESLAVTCTIQFTENGEIDSYQFYESVVCPHKSMNYQDMNELLHHHYIEGGGHFVKEFQLFRELLSNIADTCTKKERILPIRDNFLDYRLDENKQIIGIESKVKNDAELTVALLLNAERACRTDFMMHTEHPYPYYIPSHLDTLKLNAVIQLFQHMGYPIDLIENQDVKAKEVESILKIIKDDENYPLLLKMISHSFTKPYYSLEPDSINSPTALKDVPSLSHHYPELLTQRAIKKEINYLYSPTEQLKTRKLYADSIEHYQHQCTIKKTCEAAIVSNKERLFLKDEIGASFAAKVISISEYGLSIQLENHIHGHILKSNLPDYCYIKESLAYEHRVTGRQITIGTELTCLLENIREIDNYFEFSIVEKEKTKTRI